MGKYSYILFDVDGTLIDSERSVTESVRYTLEKRGIHLDRTALRRFIGPPLIESYQNFCGMDPDEAARALAEYRELYSRENIFHVEAYPGVPETLAQLRERGFLLGIASSKPLPMVERIVEHLDLAQYFDRVFGATLDGRISQKEEVLAEALRYIHETYPDISRKQILMVGDRIFDVEGAAGFGMDCVGVTYGFAPEGELEAAGPTYIVNRVEELLSIIQP